MAHQVGRLSVSTAPDVPYKDMARHCEALLMVKKQNMSTFIGVPQRQETVTDNCVDKINDSSHFPTDAGFHRVIFLYLAANLPEILWNRDTPHQTGCFRLKHYLYYNMDQS